MLINKSLENEVVTLKLTSGEELVGKLIKMDDNSIVMSKVRVLTMTQSGLGLAPYLFTVPEDAEINMRRETIVIIEKTREDMASQYVTSTTGIIV